MEKPKNKFRALSTCYYVQAVSCFRSIFSIPAIVGLLIAIHSAACASEELKDELLAKGVPEVVFKLSEWPHANVIEEKQIAATNGIVSRAGRDSNDWLIEVFNAEWRPQGDYETVFLKEEFDGRDVVRTRWKVEEYSLSVSQTRSVFVLNVTFPNELQALYRANQENFPPTVHCRRLIQRMFPKEQDLSRRHLGSERPENLADIVAWILPKQTKMVLSDGTMVSYARLVSPELSREAPWEAGYNVSWFHVFGFWNDGSNVVIYFEKTRAAGVNATRSNFSAEIDHEWFFNPDNLIPSQHNEQKTIMSREEAEYILNNVDPHSRKAMRALRYHAENEARTKQQVEK
jgi:hypothetical protein